MPAPQDQVEGRQRVNVPPPVLVEGEEEYEVERILNSQVRRGKLRYLVLWKGYGYEDISWEDADQVHAPDLITEFYRGHPEAEGNLGTQGRAPLRGG